MLLIGVDGIHFLLVGFLRTRYLFGPMHPLSFIWVYAPVIFSGFTHPLSYLGLHTRYLIWVYAPADELGSR
jgi:hypothetical protein